MIFVKIFQCRKVVRKLTVIFYPNIHPYLSTEYTHSLSEVHVIVVKTMIVENGPFRERSFLWISIS